MCEDQSSPLLSFPVPEICALPVAARWEKTKADGERESKRVVKSVEDGHERRKVREREREKREKREKRQRMILVHFDNNK